MVISAINNVKIELKFHDICKSEFISSTQQLLRVRRKK